MQGKYDVGIIGGGTAGIFAAYELTKNKPELKVVLIERGNKVKQRKCPIIEGKIQKCIKCDPCNIMRGFGGAGAFSDGKFNFTTEFGGWLNEYLSDKEVMDLINYVDKVNVNFGAKEEVYSTFSNEARQIEKKALENDLHLLHASVKHLGTELNLEILSKMYEYLSDKLTILCNTQVENITHQTNKITLEITNGESVECEYLIAAPGRSGAEWFAQQCMNLNLSVINNRIDIGVRVEIPAQVFNHITDVIYESKLIYRTKQYGDKVRTFCMNPNGYVVSENTDGIITVNGHSYTDPALGSENTNFALLVSNRLTEPFKEPYKYGKGIAKLSNMLGGGILVQRFGDLVKGRRTNEHRLKQSFVTPTLNATPGDLSLAIPKRQLDDIIEMIYALDKIAPGTANYDTLLYGVEVKFYSGRIKLTNEFETEIKNIFAIGDGAGITRGLSQAGASGIHVARRILKRM